MKKQLVGVLILMCIIIVAACTDKEEVSNENTDNERSIPVEVVEVETGDFVVERSVYGRTNPAAAVPVLAQNPGEIDTRYVENGDIVEKNDRIARITTPMGKQTVKAPRDGEVANLQLEGTVATSEEPIAMIVDTEEIHIVFSVTANVLQLIKSGDKWPVLISDIEYEAEIITKSTIPEETGLYQVKARVDNSKSDIHAGVVAEMYVTEKVVESTIIVPTEAVVTEGGDVFIYVIKNNEATKTAIEIQATQSDKTAITGELNKGDQVVISGQLTLSDQSKVEVVKEGKSS
ncbi:efflux RND transporter periplasmic adaptor subunit [Virgibacillus sp. W0430]|uniref:efflux RND transporter periplasmic adaptor subunit n=1 Tax=Virgibacillus sp. W0430 TaxID=3391580 RepID=UPI003F46787F